MPLNLANVGNQEDRAQSFLNNPFRSFDRGSGNMTANQGTPVFDPQTGMFIGLQQAGGGITTPNTRVSKSEQQGASLTRALMQNLPSILGLFNANIAPNELAQLRSSQQTSPQYAQLAQDIARSNAMSEGQTQLDLLRGVGGENVREADKLAREIDPEFYSTRTATSGALNEQLQGGLSGSEREEIQRYLNHQNNAAGTLTIPTNTSTVSNAMTFGKAGRDRVSEAIGRATQALPTFRTGVDAFQQATGRPSNTTGFQQQSGQQVFNQGQQSQNQFAGLQNTAMNSYTTLQQGKQGPSDFMSQLPDY